MTETAARKKSATADFLSSPSTELDTTELKADAHIVVTKAHAIVVDSADTWKDAGEFLRSIRTVRQRIKDTFDEPITQAHRAHKAMLAAKVEHDEPLKSAEAVVKRKMGDYKAEEERQRQAEERRLREQSQREAEEQRLAEAARLEAEGRKAQADALIAAPVIAVPVVLPTQAPKTDGVSTRKVWKFQILDPLLVPREWCIPAEKAIGSFVRAQGAAAVGLIPGVEVYSEDSVAVTGYR